MRKLFALASLATFTALGTLGLLSPVALAGDPEPDCAGVPRAQLYYSWIQTDEVTKLTKTGFQGGTVLCGNSDEVEVGYTQGMIVTTGVLQRLGTQDKYGMELRCANPDHPNACTTSSDLDEGRYVGSVEMDMVAWWAGNYFGLIDDDLTHVYVKRAPGGPDWTCPASYDPDGGGWMPEGPVVQCLQGKDVLGFGTSNMIVTKIRSGAGAGASTGQYAISILQAEAGQLDLYYAKIGSRGQWNEGQKRWEKDPTDSQQQMQLCENAGAIYGTACGSSSSLWLQKTGWKAGYRCNVSEATVTPPAAAFQVRGIFSDGTKKNRCVDQKWI